MADFPGDGLFGRDDEERDSSAGEWGLDAPPRGQLESVPGEVGLTAQEAGWRAPGENPFSSPDLDPPRPPLDSDVKTNPYAAVGFDPHESPATDPDLGPAEALSAALTGERGRPQPPRRQQRSEPDTSPFLAPPAEPSGTGLGSAPGSAAANPFTGAALEAPPASSASNPFTVDFQSRPQASPAAATPPRSAPASATLPQSSARAAVAPVVGRPGELSPDIRDAHSEFRKGGLIKTLSLVAIVGATIAAVLVLGSTADPLPTASKQKLDVDKAVIGRTLPPYRTTLEDDSAEDHREAFRKSEERARDHERGDEETRPSGVPTQSEFKDAFKKAAQ